MTKKQDKKPELHVTGLRDIVVIAVKEHDDDRHQHLVIHTSTAHLLARRINEALNAKENGK